MRYWFDTEFDDNGQSIALISIGIVAEDGREYYAVSSEFDISCANEWLLQNVVPLLGNQPKKTRDQIWSDLFAFFAQDGIPEFWADCGEYDWIVLRQLSGTITNWPQGWPWLAMDIEQWRLQLGAPHFPPQASGLHNALEDARATRERWLWLNAIANGQKTC